jgi:hypothetical protein
MSGGTGKIKIKSHKHCRASRVSKERLDEEDYQQSIRSDTRIVCQLDKDGRCQEGKLHMPC